MRDCLVFTLDDRRFAIDLATVRRVVRMVEVTALPDAPPGIAGTVNYHGEVIPVVDIRSRCRLPPRPPDPADQLVIAGACSRLAAIPVDAAEGVFALEEKSAAEVAPGWPAAARLALLDGGIVPILEVDLLLAAAGPNDREPDHGQDT